MKRLYYLVYKQTYKGEVTFLKDPDFCRGDEQPFKTYTKNDSDSVEAFLPWMSEHKATAFGQASLLEGIDGIRHFVGAVEVDFDKLINMDTKRIPLPYPHCKHGPILYGKRCLTCEREGL